ncbi:class Ib ribonucleoside-diphosphate reductase assembly flavoprotein NrdI [Erysipelotrichaceae bacterium OttesenSCG-928-M19]|nr:class Ib ribonucleoside-diphosphate reductase assembly flavoprotein NrdI [Erysipelotrichaceae bacterium OttesenSCG-928-M19]
MLVVYDSRFGTGKKFAQKLDQPIQSVEEKINEDVIFVTRNEGQGEISQAAIAFLEANKAFVKGVVVNGDKERHADTFNFAADKIAEQYGLKIIAKIQKEGNEEDVAKVKEFIASI